MRHLLQCYWLSVLVLSAQEPSGFGGLRFRELDKTIQCPVGINDLGEIAGGCSIDDYGYRISPDGVQTQLPVRGQPAGINNAGQIVLNQRGGVVLLHPDGKAETRSVDGARSVTAHGLNNKGEIAGEAGSNPVLWNAEGIPRLVSLPVVRGAQMGYLLDINDTGTLVGVNSYTGDQIFRWTPDGLYRQGAVNPATRWSAEIANDGVMIISYGRVFSALNAATDADFRTLFNFWPRRAASSLSPDGRLFLGANFIAERCPAEVTPLRAEAPLEGGSLRLSVTAESGCEWSHPAGNGEGSAEVELAIEPSASPRVVHRMIAGKDITIHQGGPACELSTPGTSFAAAPSGGTFRIPVTATGECQWSVQSDSPWLTVDGANVRTGSASVSIAVEPNTSVEDRFALLTLGPLSMRVVQAGRTCTYRVLPMGPLPAGSGAVVVPVETQPGCATTLVPSSASWLYEMASERIVHFAANPTGRARSATLLVAGEQVTLTQEAPRPGEPYSVEPFDSSGPRQTFRFKYYEPPGAEPLRFAQISVGNECAIEYRIALRPYDVRGTCTLEDASSFVEGEFRVLRLTLSLQQRGVLRLSSYPGVLGVFRSTEAPPAPIPVTRPLEIPASPPEGSSLWIDSRRGVGGVFRFRIDPSMGRPQSLAIEFAKCIVTIDPAAGSMRVENFIEADGPPKPTDAVAFGHAATLQTRYCMVDAQRSRLALPLVELAVFFPANDPSPGKTIRLRATGATGESRVTELGAYFATSTILAPSVSFHGRQLKVVFRSEVPMRQAEVEIGACLVTYSRGAAPRTNSRCSGQIEATLIGHDLVLTMSLDYSAPYGPVTIRTRFAPEGFSDTGWFFTNGNYFIGV
ncbi:MAG: BACON domain-containing protein [Bryobacterales bacterium]|nr:BACON domain-containing protein [Bryobacterales bacterium]